MKRVFYFNALFDLLMSGGPERAAVKRTADEMSVLIIPMGSTEDFCIVKSEFPKDYPLFLEDNGLDLPRLVNISERFSGNVTAHPWGWDGDAEKVFKTMGVNTFHPDFDIVKKINSREYCHQLSLIENIGVPNSVLLSSASDIYNFFSDNTVFPLVIKPAHGNSGFGFIRVSESPDRTVTDKILQLVKNNIVITEPWLNRIMDISSSVDICADGSLSEIRHYRCLVDSRGTFFGVYLADGDSQLNRYTALLDSCVKNCAAYIYKSGYFGPVGFDSFVYLQKDGSEALAPIIEINARHVMSDIARSLKNKLTPDKYVFYRLLSSKRAKLPEKYSQLKSILKKNLFSANTKKGILPVTPLKNTTDVTRQPYRNAFFISAGSERELFELDSFLMSSVCRR
ncbi:MAG: hypothetical protein LBB56_01555 [Chitinispirillales bacterium]|jgi:D-alanine-D-alanine ligase-like ATP-grasp enzyme|nr:hypothetical protein [Chitinispirillales bacterium]